MVKGVAPTIRRLGFGCAYAFLLAVMLCGLALPAAALEIAVVTSQREGSGQVVAEAMLAASGKHRLVHAGNTEKGLDPERLGNSVMVIALGAQAARAVAAADTRPMLVALVSAADYERLRQETEPRTITALFINQPAERHLLLMQLILPQASCAGLLLGPESHSALTHFEPAAKSAGIALESSFSATAKDVLPALERHLARCDAVLTLDDAIVSHPNVARAALLTSYRMQRPLFAYSRAWVEAGALAAVFSTPATAARDLLDWLDLLSDPQRLPPPRAARHFDLAVNARVARALGLSVPDEETLRAAITAGRKP